MIVGDCVRAFPSFNLKKKKERKKWVSHFIVQAGLKLLGSSDPPVSASESAGITDMSHCSQPEVLFFDEVRFIKFSFIVYAFCILADKFLPNSKS